MKRYAPCIPEEAIPGSMCERSDGTYYLVEDVQCLLSRCLDALESDKMAAAEKMDMNKGYPAREPRFQRWLDEATALHNEVKAIVSDSATNGLGSRDA